MTAHYEDSTPHAMDGSRRVVVTGIGAVTPLGVGAEATWRGLIAGDSGVGPLTNFDCSTFPVRIAGQVSQSFDPHLPGISSTDRQLLTRQALFGLAAVVEALDDAGLTDSDFYPPSDRGVAMASTIAQPEPKIVVDIMRARQQHGDDWPPMPQHPDSTLAADPSFPVNVMARLAGATGPMLSMYTACASAGNSIGEAFRLVQEGDARMMIAGGFDAMTTWIDLLGFSLLGTLTDQYNDNPTAASRPFEASRSGFVLGEGAVVFVLEDLESALARGAHIHAEVSGFGSTMNAWRVTDSPPDGMGPTQAIEEALRDAHIPPQEVDYVVAHGTGTRANDLAETNALKKVFGDQAYKLAISSPKSMTGHLTAAAASMSMFAAVRALEEAVVPPTINLDVSDPELDLDYVPHVARHMQVRTALVNAFAFGGCNTSLIVRAFKETQ